MKVYHVIFLIAIVASFSESRAFEASVSDYLKLSDSDLKTTFDNDKTAVEQVYLEANRAFEDEKFVEAVQLYNLLVSGGQSSDFLYLNLGAAHFRSGSPGAAALWFRRASHLKPGIPEVRQNFEFLRRQQGLLEFSSEGWQRWLLRTSPGGLGWAGWLPLWAALFSILLIVFGKKSNLKPLYVVTVVFAGAGSIFFFWLGWYRAHNLAPHNFATVVEKGASALTAPAPDASAVVALPEGSEIRVLEDTGPWIYASIPGDLVGWVHHSTIEKNWPIPKEKSNFLPLGNDL